MGELSNSPARSQVTAGNVTETTVVPSQSLKSPPIDTYESASRAATKYAATTGGTFAPQSFFGNGAGFRISLYPNLPSSTSITMQQKPDGDIVIGKGSNGAEFRCSQDDASISIRQNPNSPSYSDVSVGLSSRVFSIGSTILGNPTLGGRCEVRNNSAQGALVAEYIFPDPQNPRNKDYASATLAWWSSRNSTNPHPSVQNPGTNVIGVNIAVPAGQAPAYVSPTAITQDGTIVSGSVSTRDKNGNIVVEEGIALDTSKKDPTQIQVELISFGETADGGIFNPTAMSQTGRYVFGSVNSKAGAATNDLYRNPFIIDRKNNDALVVAGPTIKGDEIIFPEFGSPLNSSKIVSRTITEVARQLQPEEGERPPVVLLGNEEYELSSSEGKKTSLNRTVFSYRDPSQEGGYWVGKVPLAYIDQEKKTAFVPGTDNESVSSNNRNNSKRNAFAFSDGIIVGEGYFRNTETGEKIGDKEAYVYFVGQENITLLKDYLQQTGLYTRAESASFFGAQGGVKVTSRGNLAYVLADVKLIGDTPGDRALPGAQLIGINLEKMRDDTTK
jgi:hypothetical protein